jgi:hypothetical protein
MWLLLPEEGLLPEKRLEIGLLQQEIELLQEEGLLKVTRATGWQHRCGKLAPAHGWSPPFATLDQVL